MEQSDKEYKELRVIIDLNLYDKVKKMKEFYGINNNADLIRFLLNKEFRQIHKPKNKISNNEL